MRPRWILFLVFVAGGLVGIAQPSFGQGATVRGRLMAQGPAGEYPLTRTQVTLVAAPPASPVRSAPSVTGTDGMFYFSNIPAGAYILEILVKPNSAPAKYSVRVVAPKTDIPAIRILLTG